MWKRTRIASTAYKSLRNDPAAGEAPLLLKMNPILIDLFPTWFDWFSRYHPEKMDFFYSPY